MKPMKRTNVYLTEKQLERLRNQAEKESVAMAEIIRRAVEVYLAWNDPLYNYEKDEHMSTQPSTSLQKECPFYP